jgi:hypothetical protein
MRWSNRLLKVAAQASNTKKVAADRNLENIFAAD